MALFFSSCLRVFLLLSKDYFSIRTDFPALCLSVTTPPFCSARQVHPSAEENVQARPAGPVPDQVEKADRNAGIPERHPGERRELGPVEPVPQGRGKKKVFIVPVDGGQVKKEVFEVKSDTGFPLQEWTEVQANPHFL